MKYDPQVNDYVIWSNKEHVQGWVYFKDKDYLTIETLVTPKHAQSYEDCSLHQNTRVLVLCYRQQWSQLNYVKSRRSPHEC